MTLFFSCIFRKVFAVICWYTLWNSRRKNKYAVFYQRSIPRQALQKLNNKYTETAQKKIKKIFFISDIFWALLPLNIGIINSLEKWFLESWLFSDTSWSYRYHSHFVLLTSPLLPQLRSPRVGTVPLPFGTSVQYRI